MMRVWKHCSGSRCDPLRTRPKSTARISQAKTGPWETKSLTGPSDQAAATLIHHRGGYCPHRGYPPPQRRWWAGTQQPFTPERPKTPASYGAAGTPPQ
eukprot:2968000-Pyramimonas_sp.AAC.1